MSCERYEEQIALAVGGDLDAGEARRLDRHLAACDPCRAFAEEMRQSRRAVRQLAQAPIGDEIRLSGRIEEIEFLGNKLRYLIDLAGLTARVDVCREGDQALLHVGDQVVLGLDPAHIRILEH